MMTESECTSSSHAKDEAKPSYRKSNKPLMEKRRRTRINTCLVQLKGLVLQAMKKDHSQYSKLEKADILELTVKHLRNVQRSHIGGAALTGEVAASRYRAGFRECAQEIVRFLGSGAAGVPDDVRGRILSHLTRTLTTLTEQQQQHQYHHHQLQHHQPVHHLVQQSSGLVSIHHITSGPHPAFPTTTGVHQPTCLSSGLSPLASSHVSGLSGPSIMAATPASMALVSAQNTSIASLATAPTAFQTPPLNCGTNSSIKLGSNSLSAMPPGPLQVALVLTSPPASMHALPIFTPTGSGEVPPNIVSGPSVAFQTRGSPPNASADGSELLFQRQAEPRQSPLLVSSPSSPVTSGASTPAQSSRIISHEKFRRKSSSSHEPLSLPSTSHGRGVDFSTQGGLSCDDKVWRPW